MKPHIKVIQRNGVDVFVTSSIEYKSNQIKQQELAIMHNNAINHQNNYDYGIGYAGQYGLIGLSNSLCRSILDPLVLKHGVRK